MRDSHAHGNDDGVVGAESRKLPMHTRGFVAADAWLQCMLALSQRKGFFVPCFWPRLCSEFVFSQVQDKYPEYTFLASGGLIKQSGRI